MVGRYSPAAARRIHVKTLWCSALGGRVICLPFFNTASLHPPTYCSVVTLWGCSCCAGAQHPGTAVLAGNSGVRSVALRHEIPSRRLRSTAAWRTSRLWTAATSPKQGRANALFQVLHWIVLPRVGWQERR
ncbi:hypothetical protein CHLRE_02g111108v5 [Chlamydomonas reinhardtii]|uniref:Uncharacterized protein n=1 Tax=Chlamydomonas reinhardtii TaxID=3055 RepID=A0A2K3E301_CHLRE|nr:uncharacterized protein CHLRE_02g111108v5 [Chlamydomonas reinhardtii]PNW87152.1 hypothetical protein CHLRE_02g111108v5 [Chlamydomonas reinhardtii]